MLGIHRMEDYLKTYMWWSPKKVMNALLQMVLRPHIVIQVVAY